MNIIICLIISGVLIAGYNFLTMKMDNKIFNINLTGVKKEDGSETEEKISIIQFVLLIVKNFGKVSIKTEFSFKKKE